jgi:hypothetical protein
MLYLEEMDHAAARIVKLEQAIDEAVGQAPPEISAVIEALQALRGVAQTTAATIVSELGSLSRFPSPRPLMGYSGLVAREHSRGNRVQRGGITKTGNGHLRRVLVEAAWAYQHRPNAKGKGRLPPKSRKAGLIQNTVRPEGAWQGRSISENHFQRQLYDTGFERGIVGAEVRVRLHPILVEPGCGGDAGELCVVPGVEQLSPELDEAALGE